MTTTREALGTALADYMQSLENAEFLAAESFAEGIAAAAAEAEAAATALYIVYYYDTDAIRDTIYMLTHFKAKNARTQDKEPKDRLDELTITEDESDMLDRLLKLAAKDVYGLVAAYGKDISSGYVFNLAGTNPGEYDDEVVYNTGDLFYSDSQLYYTIADDTPAGTDPTDTDWFAPVGEYYNTYHKMIFTIHYDENMDPSKITILNDDLEDAIIKHVILGWYRAIGEMNMLALSNEEYEDAAYKVRNSIMFRKTPVRRRTEMI